MHHIFPDAFELVSRRVRSASLLGCAGNDRVVRLAIGGQAFPVLVRCAARDVAAKACSRARELAADETEGVGTSMQPDGLRSRSLQADLAELTRT